VDGLPRRGCPSGMWGFSRSQASDTAEFTTMVVPASGAPDALAVADVNHDGAPDILAGNAKLARLRSAW
jgi:hypothetical protein